MNRYEQQFYEDLKTIKHGINKIAEALKEIVEIQKLYQDDRKTDRKNKPVE